MKRFLISGNGLFKSYALIKPLKIDRRYNHIHLTVEDKIGSWKKELNYTKSLWNQNKASEAIKKCNELIRQIELLPHVSRTQANHILCNAYIFKGDFLRLTGALERHAQEAFVCYSKALSIMPGNQAAKDGIENLRIIRGESTNIIVEEPDPEISLFKFS